MKNIFNAYSPVIQEYKIYEYKHDQTNLTFWPLPLLQRKQNQIKFAKNNNKRHYIDIQIRKKMLEFRILKIQKDCDYTNLMAPPFGQVSKEQEVSV